jgi:hypothetical protein
VAKTKHILNYQTLAWQNLARNQTSPKMFAVLKIFYHFSSAATNSATPKHQPCVNIGEGMKVTKMLAVLKNFYHTFNYYPQL